jgi:hypothetical protein
MLFRGNAAGHWVTGCDVQATSVTKPARGQKVLHYPQGDPAPSGADLLWLTGHESPILRKTYLDELNAERFGLPGKAAR